MGMRSSKTVALGALPVMAAAFLAGCGDDDEVAYCTDPNGTIVDNSYCDDDFNNGGGGGGGFFWGFVAGNAVGNLGRGSRLPASAQRIRSNDTAALSKKGGFGSKASASGVGRSTSSSSGRSSSGGG